MLDVDTIPLCPKDESHGYMVWIGKVFDDDYWECFTCGTTLDAHGVVIHGIKFCHTNVGGIINN